MILTKKPSDLLPEFLEVWAHFQQYLDKVEGSYILGGSIIKFLDKADYTTDIDFCFNFQKDFNKAYDYFNKNYKVLYETDNSVSFDNNGDKYDLVKIMKSPENMADSVDFTINTFTIGRDFVCYEDSFYEDWTNKILSFKSTKDPIKCLTRINKYGKRSYRLPHEESEKLIQNLFKQSKSYYDCPWKLNKLEYIL